MSDTYSPGALAIMEAAERLIGRHGIDGVSMRQITLAARMGNNSAIAYHFGDRDGLLAAVSRWRGEVVARERQRLANLALADGSVGCPRRIIQILTRPVLLIRAADGSHPHAAFVSQMLRTRLGREIRIHLHTQYGIGAELVSRLHGHVPDVPRDLFDFRLRTASLAFYDSVVERDQMGTDDPARLQMDEATFLEELDAMVLAIALRR